MVHAPGAFIEPDRRLETVDDPLGILGQRTYSGYRSVIHMGGLLGRNPILDAVIWRTHDSTLNYEDQCSATYYADLSDDLLRRTGSLGRIVEVGVFQGGASVFLASAAMHAGIPLDLVDIDANFLRFSFERVRRTFPQFAGKIRLFQGNLAQYIQTVTLPEETGNIYLHHDASHEFKQVVKDLSAVSFARRKIDVLAIQDTNLRGRIEYCNFVDAAIWAVFGRDVLTTPIGTSYRSDQTEMVEPNWVQGNYFLPDVPEGAIIDLRENDFRYPHPSMTLDMFL